ncbi:MAG TPA: hypothetical protein VNO33_17095 [Kofleriaceae bacterium]|nr:hypothetical protein [Kofleriaceae bacterium]
MRSTLRWLSTTLLLAAMCGCGEKPARHDDDADGPDAAGGEDGDDGGDDGEDGEDFTAPSLHISHGGGWTDFDQWWCRGSMIAEQDPIFTNIRRDRFEIDPVSDVVTVPAEWIAEARDARGPQLEQAAQARVPGLLESATRLVGRRFGQRDLSYFFYLCPFFDGGTASARVFPMFMYLESAVGPEQQWADWLFTDQYLFHELLHSYIIEAIDYTRGTPILNQLYAELVADEEFTAASQRYLGYPDPITREYEARWTAVDQAQMVGLVLTHVHVYAIMTAVMKQLGEQERLDTIRAFETGTSASHPSYVRAWQHVIAIESDEAALAALLAEVK